ncbi:MAG TPA: efflux RND transporter periplasmic adaptor subunit [Gemmatimonadales bacterium]|nr:efflux RND transporter periplasmic adaptor subunit [Gemmatimonadales bacterium]
MTKTKNVVTLLLILATVGAVWACSKASSAEETPTETPATVVGPENIVTAQADTIRTGPSISGTLDAERNATLRAELTAQVTAVLVEPGTPVSAGQVLVRLDQTGVRDQYLSAQSALRAAETSAELGKSDLARDQRLNEAGALSTRQLEVTRRASLQADAMLADARARYATAELNLRRTEIRAPFRGVVASRPARVGDMVQTGAAIATVVDPGSLRLEAQVPVDQLATLKLGTPVLFTVSGYEGRQFRGTVTRMSPAVDPVTRQVPIVVRLPNIEGALVSGLFAQGRVATKSRAGITVPSTAIDQRGLRPVVYRIKGGRLERVEVTLGFEDPVAERTEVLTGLAGGDTLVMGSAQGLPPGTPIRITAPAERPAAGPTAGRSDR